MNERGLTGSTLDAATVLVGVDDTDNRSSRGTGFLVQRMIAEMEAAGLGRVLGATHHQLFVHDAIPYTSHNSSVCIAIDQSESPQVERLVDFCSTYLETESAPGSDPGLAVATRDPLTTPAVVEALVRFGRSAKSEVLDLDRAVSLAGDSDVHLSGHGGTDGGMIGALAAVGLHCSGTDGFFLWMPGLRETEGRPTYDELRKLLPIDAALAPDRTEPDGADVIELVDWVRPLWTGSQAILLLLPSLDEQPTLADARLWRLAPRYMVREFAEEPAWEA